MASRRILSIYHEFPQILHHGTEGYRTSLASCKMCTYEMYMVVLIISRLNKITNPCSLSLSEWPFWGRQALRVILLWRTGSNLRPDGRCWYLIIVMAVAGLNSTWASSLAVVHQHLGQIEQTYQGAWWYCQSTRIHWKNIDCNAVRGR
jgi:hypothetical protein